MNLKRTPVKPLKAEFRSHAGRLLFLQLLANLSLMQNDFDTFYERLVKASNVVAFIRRAVPLQMVSDMRRTRRQVLYAGKAGDARYSEHSCASMVRSPLTIPFSYIYTSEWPLASTWSPEADSTRYLIPPNF
ncbi:hypothetical protein Tco_0640390 [Tanacetum coccineum]